MTDSITARVVTDLAIRNLIARIAHLADQGDLDEYAQQFTDDAAWEFPTGPRYGRADIRAGAGARRADGVTGPGSATRHVVTTVAVTVDDSDTATSDSYWVFWRDTTTEPKVFNMGAYHDTFRREDQIWRLARRQITLG